MYHNPFCLNWKSNGISFNKEIEELKLNFKVVDVAMSHKNDKNVIKYKHKPKKVQPQLTNMIGHNLETFYTDSAIPYAIYLSRLSRVSAKSYRDMTDRELEKCKKDCVV